MKTHGHSIGGTLSRTYTTWAMMKNRCKNKNAPNYPRYGGRGITYCERWDHFDNFLTDMGERPIGKTLDRIDTNGQYSPENCRWSSVKDQQRNTRTTVFISYKGETRCLSEWAEILGVKKFTLIYRLKHWPIEHALSKIGTHVRPRSPEKIKLFQLPYDE